MVTIVALRHTEAVDEGFDPIDGPGRLKSIGGLGRDEVVSANERDSDLQEIGITGDDLRLDDEFTTACS